jgi:hypothetical protein
MKASVKYFFYFALAIFLTASILTSCNSSSNKDKNASQQDSDTLKKEITLSPETKNLLYQFPVPFEVTNMLEKAKAGFIFDMTNPISNVGNYGTEKSRSLNLGIYSADLCYAATYNKNDETAKLLGCTNKLADQLGISGAYDQNFLDKVKKAGNNKDTLAALIGRIFSSTNDFLSKNNRNQVSIMVITGGFVEALYLAAALNIVAKDNKQISTIILKQKDNFDKLLIILDAYNEDEIIRSIGEEVIKLKPVFTDYGLEEGKKLPHDKAVQVSDLTAYVRGQFIK